MRYKPPLQSLKALAEAQAILFYACEIEDIEDAIKPLMSYAMRRNIVENIGAAATMKIIHAAFNLPPEGDVSKNSRIEKYEHTV